MATSLSPPPLRQILTDNLGVPSKPWADWLQRLFKRNVEDFAALTEASGYQKLPSGLVIQWGTEPACLTGTNVVVTFPIPFNNACLTVISGIMNNGLMATGTTGQWGTESYLTASFQFNNRTSKDQEFNWIAVGY